MPNDSERQLLDFSDKFRAELKADLKDFKADLKEDIIRELGGVGDAIKIIKEDMKSISGEIDKSNDRITKVENRLDVFTKRWPTSAIVLTTALLAAVIALLSIVAKVMNL